MGRDCEVSAGMRAWRTMRWFGGSNCSEGGLHRAERLQRKRIDVDVNM